MEHLIIRLAKESERALALEYARTTIDGNLVDLDIFAHDSTFLLAANQSQELGNFRNTTAFLPVQQPLMLENLLFAEGLSNGERARAMTRLAEYAIAEAHRRDVGELYFLCRDKSTCDFAARHKFRNMRDVIPGVEVYRLNIRETFGC